MFSSPFHPQTNAVLERFHGTLKNRFRKLSHECPTCWDKYLDAALYTYCSLVHSATGFCPFYLLFSRAPRGPMAMLHDLFTRQNVSADTYFWYHYNIDLHNKIKTSCRIAQVSASEVADRDMNLSQASRFLNLVTLLWSSCLSLTISWFSSLKVLLSSVKAFAQPEGVAYVSAVNEDHSSVGGTPPLPSTSDIKSKVQINPTLDSYKLSEVNDILDEFSDVLTALPEHTPSFMHHIELTTDVPIRVKPYPPPFSSQDFVHEETAKLLDLVIEPSISCYCSPIVLVKKKDGSLRRCIDFRRINEVIRFDTNNIPPPEDLFVQLANSTVFSSCNLLRAYWQVPLSPHCRHITAFQTLLGLMQWVRMPLGLVNAPATFCRLMHIVLKDLPSVLSCFDHSLVHIHNWSQHPSGLCSLLTALRAHGFTDNPEKLSIGQTRTAFLLSDNKTPCMHKVN
ncbi:reverse transcriptase [Plakobranchus ocellatus]|uniref:Reverse transcriptase n=1 Tax=Plakobranchus ocellatus TaxID=259542 RepID=A0AAV4BUS8_9GAST|nr:reverse transcriptase [Plakobranchus ocellatus]